MSVISFKCPNCDGELVFEPSSGKYKCEYCFSLFTQEELDAMKPAETEEQPKEQETEQETDAEQTGGEKEEADGEAVVYSCPSCGAQIVTDETTAASFCYYCHNPVVLGGRLSGDYLPDKIIPFSIDKKEAEKRFLDYVKDKKFVPRAFFNKKQIEKLSGVYFPYWVYDARMSGNLEAEATDVRVWVTGDTEYTETKYYAVERGGDMKIKNMTENALKKANKKLVEGVLPYRMEECRKFTLGYLSGFGAEKRDMEKSEFEADMKNQAKEYAVDMMRDTIENYSGVKVKNSNIQIKNEKWSYLLLPVWTLTYRARGGKTFYYSLNGQTGKVCGELPIDYKKLGCVSAIVSAAAFVIGLIGGWLI